MKWLQYVAAAGALFGGVAIAGQAAAQAAIVATLSGPSQAATGAQVSFDASGSTGDIQTYDWTFGDGSSASGGVMMTHVYDAPGSYTVTVDAIGEDGEDATASLTVTVVAAAVSSDFPTASPATPADLRDLPQAPGITLVPGLMAAGNLPLGDLAGLLTPFEQLPFDLSGLMPAQQPATTLPVTAPATSAAAGLMAG